MCAGAALFGVLIWSAGKPVRPVWSAADGTPIPADFLLIQYPIDDDVALFDAPDGNRVGSLERAVANTYTEVGTNRWVAVSESVGTLWVRADALVYSTEPARADRLFKAYERHYKSAAPLRSAQADPFRSAQAKMNVTSDGQVRERFRRTPDDDHVEEFVYVIDGNSAHPLEQYRYFGPTSR